MYGVGEQLIKCQKGICHPELVSGSHKEITNRVRNDKKLFPRPLWERKEFLNERSEFRNSGEGSKTLANRKPLTRICSSLCSHNCVLSHKGRGMVSSKHAAFTLAEVLITLGIIGIVAAMTIPTLIANYQEKQTISRLQKAYATLKNALEMAKVDHGDYEMWSWNQIPQEDSKRIQYFWETYGFPHLKVAKKCFPDTDPCRSQFRINDTTLSNPDTNNGAFILNDGTSVFSWAGGNTYFPHVWLYVDINGDSKPNEMGKDIFVMYFSPNNPGNKIGSVDDDGNFVDSGKVMQNGYGLTLYGEANGVTVDDLLDPNFVMQSETGVNTNISCTRAGKRQTCAAAIKLNNWKIPDGYLE